MYLENFRRDWRTTVREICTFKRLGGCRKYTKQVFGELPFLHPQSEWLFHSHINTNLELSFLKHCKNHHCQRRLIASFLQSFRSYLSASQWYNLTWNPADKRFWECISKVSPMKFREQWSGFDNSQYGTNINYDYIKCQRFIYLRDSTGKKLFIICISKEFLNPQILIKQLLGINPRKTV